MQGIRHTANKRANRGTFGTVRKTLRDAEQKEKEDRYTYKASSRELWHPNKPKKSNLHFIGNRAHQICYVKR